VIKEETMPTHTVPLDRAASVGSTYLTVYLSVEDDAPDELTVAIPDVDLVLVLHRDDIPACYLARPDVAQADSRQGRGIHLVDDYDANGYRTH
jgi:hypothetical protein